MAIHDLSSQRLFVDAALSAGTAVTLAGPQAHYLVNVMRMKPGDGLHVFNGRDGEWYATISLARKRDVTLTVGSQTRPQLAGPDVHYLFAPLKHARLDYMVQKATELGVRVLQPVMTRRTIAERVNLDRMHENVVEAAEQCGILTIPEVRPPLDLGKALDILAAEEIARRVVFCDEEALASSPVAALEALARPDDAPPPPLAVVVGPEGGFDPAERERLLAHPGAVPISLGPRIMRADTAAVAALALVNAITGRGW